MKYIQFTGSMSFEDGHHGLESMSQDAMEQMIEQAIDDYVRLKHPDVEDFMSLVSIVP